MFVLSSVHVVGRMEGERKMGREEERGRRTSLGQGGEAEDKHPAG